jgi:inorganic triphosphatase YgiF
MALLVQANRWMAAGRQAEAAGLFAQLAQHMTANQHPRRAAEFHAMAAHAFADSHSEQNATEHARSALQMFIQYKMNRRTMMFFANITQKMNALGMHGAADQLEKEFGGQVKQLPAAPAAERTARHGMLPTNCTKCGAPIHANEADWVDDNTVECDYCGALIRSGLA